MRIVGPSLVNMAIYSLTKQHKNEDITGTGLAIAGSAGLLSGGASVGLGAAAGGGLLGPAVWAPTTVTINATGNVIAKQY